MSREDFRSAIMADPVDLGLACLLMGTEVEPGLDVSIGLAALDALALAVPPADPSDPRECAAALRSVLASFGGVPEDYADLRSSLLHEVLRRRRGLPILLAVVWLEAARRAELPAYPVGLPGYFLVGVGLPTGEHVLVDPFRGGTEVNDSDGARRYNQREVVLRVLNNVRAQAAARPDLLESNRTALWATELSLLLPRHPAALRRERGVLLARVGQFGEGAAELETYAEAIAEGDPTAAEKARREAGQARARLN
ncbi:MAG: transglutaminase-like domain-containing protein [Pseudonocardiales bacterium]